MKVSQIRVSRNVKFFAERMKSKFNLTDIHNRSAPVIMYGCYNKGDYEFFETYEPYIIVLWRGTDARILNPKKAARILKKKNCRHYAGSRSVYNSLKQNGIKADILPITSTSLDIPCLPRGNYVYCYICSKTPVMMKRYHYDWLRKLERTLPYKFIYTSQHQYSFEKLKEIYGRCFVGIRLLDHDGMSNSILEMGLMGRQTISNSDLPHIIKWKTMASIKKAIIKQYKTRLKDNSKISETYRQLIDIGDSWLEI